MTVFADSCKYQALLDYLKRKTHGGSHRKETVLSDKQSLKPFKRTFGYRPYCGGGEMSCHVFAIRKTRVRWCVKPDGNTCISID